jgi:hypothetical protein
MDVKQAENQADDLQQAAPKLVCYALNDYAPKLVAARPDRKWMDDFPGRHPYRCLPLSIANAFGWHLLCPVPFEVEWNGGPEVSDLTVRPLKPLPWGRPFDTFCRSTFSHGIVTMIVDYIFQTSPGWDLLTTGPANSFKDNACPLTGIMESSWLPYPFSMNWQVMRPGRVLFEEDEPFCAIYPVQQKAMLACEPEIRRLPENPELEKQATAFRIERAEFTARLHAGDPEARKMGWTKHYFIGEFADGTRVTDHLNKLRLKEPVDRREVNYARPFSPYRITLR